MQLYLEKIEPDKDGNRKRYKVVSFNKETGVVVLQGSAATTFEEKFDRAHFEKMGYNLIQVDE